MTILDACALLLAAERDPSLRDHADFAPAQEKVLSNAAASEWFAAEKAFFAKHEGLLGGTTLRPASRERIRAALLARQASGLGLDAAVSVDEGQGSVEEVATPPKPIQFPRRSLLWLAAAAAIIVASLVILPRFLADGSSIEANDFAEFGTQFLDGAFTLDRSTKNIAASGDFLGEEGSPFDLAAFKLHDTPTVGCKVLNWDGETVSLLCLKHGDEIVHLMVMDRTGIDPKRFKAGSLKVNERETQSWIHDDNAYLALAFDHNVPLNLPPGVFAGL